MGVGRRGETRETRKGGEENAHTGPPRLFESIVRALEMHRADPALVRSALGCCALLGASCSAARPLLSSLRPQLEQALDRAEALAAALEFEDAGAQWLQAGEEAQRLRRVLRLCK